MYETLAKAGASLLNKPQDQQCYQPASLSVTEQVRLKASTISPE